LFLFRIDVYYAILILLKPKKGDDESMKLIKPILIDELKESQDMISLADEAWRENGDINFKQIKGVTLSEEDFSKLSFEHVVFENCHLTDCSFYKASFTDVVFKSCELSNSDFTDGYFNRCEFNCTKGVGVKLVDGSITNLAFLDCNFRYAEFGGAAFDRLLVEKSDLNDSLFNECSFKQVEFNDSSFNGTSFFKTTLRGIDFTKCEISGITVSDNFWELKGAIINEYQAVELSKLLGVVIK
jgi:uncharacterized protein YjbI with pentapeptide repeats